MKPIKAIVFDLYGTLYDVHSVAGMCGQRYPGRGLEISILWRQKQLEYTWLHSLMGDYIPFEKATEDALHYVAEHLKLTLSTAAHKDLCDAYLRLQPYPEVDVTLNRLRSKGLPLAILSNGSSFSINSVVESSRLTHYFDHLISVETVRTFKPQAKVYELAEAALKASREEILFVSSNAWDACGARHFGYQVCWVNRGEKTLDVLGQTPDFQIASLQELPELVTGVPATSRL
jgi:2-haloacid dehalogenase